MSEEGASVRARARWRPAIVKRQRKLEWAKERGRLDLVARHEAAIARMQGYIDNAERRDRARRRRERIRAERRATTEAFLETMDRRFESIDAAGIEARWSRERKEAEKQDRVARRTGADRAGFEGGREEQRRPGQNPLSGARDLLTVNARHDVLEYLFARRKITEPEKLAGDHFRRLCEIAGLSGAKGIDYERAGGGTAGPKTPIADHMLHAARQLDRIEARLGVQMFNMMIRVIHHGISLSEYARLADQIDAKDSRISSKKMRERFTGWMFRLALRELARITGARGPNRDIPDFPRMGKKPEIKDNSNVWRAPDAVPSDRPELRETRPPADES